MAAITSALSRSHTYTTTMAATMRGNEAIRSADDTFYAKHCRCRRRRRATTATTTKSGDTLSILPF